MDTTTVHAPPDTRDIYERRETPLDDHASVAVSCGAFGESDSAQLVIHGSIARIQIGVLMSREQLEQHRDACNAVLVAMEQAR